MKVKKLLASLLVVALTVGLISTAAGAFRDAEDHWAKDSILRWSEAGIVVGDDNGDFRPDAPMTRAEFAMVLDRLMGYHWAPGNPFTDVPADAWYAEAVLGANAAGILMGTSGTTASPLAQITREQAMVLMGRALSIDENSAAVSQYSDAAQVSSWAAGYVGGLTAAGLVEGSGGKVNPQDSITRAEIVTILDRAVSDLVSTAGEYSKDAAANLIVNTDGVTLKDMTVAGNLIIAEGVKDGEVILDNVTVEGKMVIRGGGENSVIIRGASSVAQVIVSRVDGVVRVEVVGDADVEVVYIDDGSDDVIIEGTVGDVQVAASDITVNAVGAAIKNVRIEGERVDLIVDGASRISLVEISAPGAQITGSGKVTSVTAGADNASIGTPNTKITASEGVSGVTGAGGAAIEAGTTETNNSAGTDIVRSPGGGTYVPPPVTVASVSVVDGGDGYTEVIVPAVGQVIRANIILSDSTIIGTYPVNEAATYTWYYKESTDTIIGTESSYTVTSDNIGKTICIEVTVDGYAGSAIWEAARIVIDKPVVNETKAIGYETIQAAIADADTDDTISVAAGNYAEVLTIDKSITLVGTAGTKINATNAACAVVNANNVTLDGITFNGTWGIQVGVGVTGTVVKNCAINLAEADPRGEGALRFLGGNGAIFASDNTMNGTLWVFGTEVNQDLSGIVGNTIKNALFTGLGYHANNETAGIKDGLTAQQLYDAQASITLTLQEPMRLVAIENMAWDLVDVIVNTDGGLAHALTKAAEGATLRLAAGDYTFGETLLINKAMTLEGFGATKPVIKNAINIASNGVTLKNIECTLVDRSSHNLLGIEGLAAIYVNGTGVTLDGITVAGTEAQAAVNGRAVIGHTGASYTVRNSTFENVKTGIFAHSGNSATGAVQVTLTATGNTFTNVWAGIGGTEKTDLTATGNTFVSIQDGGEGIGLGGGAVVIRPAGEGTDIAYLKSSNTFVYAIGNKVMDYRLEGEIDTFTANPARLARVTLGYSVVVPLSSGTYQGASVVISLYDAIGDLMQANTMAKDVGLTNTTSTTFDTTGTFNYVADGYWTVVGSVVGVTEDPAKAVIEITLANGKELTHVITEYWS